MDAKTLREVHKKEFMSPTFRRWGRVYRAVRVPPRALCPVYGVLADIFRLAVLLAELENAKALATEITRPGRGRS